MFCILASETEMLQDSKSNAKQVVSLDGRLPGQRRSRGLGL